MDFKNAIVPLLSRNLTNGHAQASPAHAADASGNVAEANRSTRVRPPMSPHNSELLTIAEAAAALRLQPSTLRSWILNRRIPFVKLGSRVFIRRSDLEILIAASVVPAREDRIGNA